MAFQFIDIIILALIAFFIFLRYRSTLGKDIGHKPDSNASNLRQQMGSQLEEKVVPMPGAHKADESPKEKKVETIESEIEKAQITDSAVIEGLQAIRAADADFSLAEFTEGAKTAFEWVLNAFDKGDKKTLNQLMSSEVFEDFAAAIDARENDPQRTYTTLVSIENVDFVAVALENKRMARITLSFHTEQIQYQKDQDGNQIKDEQAAVQSMVDEWEFERDVTSPNPIWKIVST
jgi:predicted lipid-binding transport protein (Tim44 family)